MRRLAYPLRSPAQARAGESAALLETHLPAAPRPADVLLSAQ